MTARRRTIVTSCLGLVLLTLAAPRATAQYDTDPYDPWNAMYRPFVIPNYYSNPALPNQARLDFLAGAESRYGTYFESVTGGFDPNLFDTTPRLGGRGVPYYQVYSARRAAAGLTGPDERTYIPNRDDTFYQDQAARQQRFFEALRETNPRERARKLQEIEAERQAAARSVSSPFGVAEPARTPRRPGTRSGRERPEAPLAPEEPTLTPTPTERPARPTTGRFDLLRPLAPSGAPAAPGDADEAAPPLPPGDLQLRRTPPQSRYRISPAVEDLLERPAEDDAGGLPAAPEPR